MKWFGGESRRPGPDRIDPARHMEMKVELYTRPGCHLCDEAAEILSRHGLSPKLINIDLDAVLVARYGNCVPVVVMDGRERFRGRVEERLLRRLLRGAPGR